MQSVLDDIINVSSNIDITGNIYICDELCSLSFDYKDNKNMVITNNDITLNIDYNNNSSVSYNGGDEFGSNQTKYILRKIVFIGPPKHFIKSFRRTNGVELILIHESEDGKRFQNICVLLYGLDNCASQKKIQYKLFNEIADNIPTKVDGKKKVDIEEWSVNDLLPDEKSFYTYNSLTNNSLNWIVFKEEVCVPTNFIDKYFKYVLNPDKKNSALLQNAPIPNNPKGLILFGHQVIKNTVPLSCAKKIASNLSNSDSTDDKEDGDKDSNVKNIESNKKEDIKKDDNKKESEKKEDNKKDDIKKKDIKKDDIKDDKKDDKTDDKKGEDEKKPFSWFWFIFKILIIIITIIIIFAAIYFAISKYFPELKEKIINGVSSVYEKVKSIIPSFPTIGTDIQSVASTTEIGTGTGTGTGTGEPSNIISTLPQKSNLSKKINSNKIRSRLNQNLISKI